MLRMRWHTIIASFEYVNVTAPSGHLCGSDIVQVLQFMQSLTDYPMSIIITFGEREYVHTYIFTTKILLDDVIMNECNVIKFSLYALRHVCNTFIASKTNSGVWPQL